MVLRMSLNIAMTNACTIQKTIRRKGPELIFPNRQTSFARNVVAISKSFFSILVFFPEKTGEICHVPILGDFWIDCYRQDIDL